MSNNIKVPIKGMHCRSCEILIEENLKEIPSIKTVEVDYKAGEAVIHYDGLEPNSRLINKAIVDAGYEIGQDDELPFLTKNKQEYLALGEAFMLLVAIFLALKFFGVTSLNFSPSLASPSWGLIIIIGLVAGISTCMALIGGLSLGLSAKFAENHPTATPAEKFRPHLFFIGGRVLSYTALGGLLGAVGKVFQFSATTNGILTLLVGGVMLIMGLQLINIFPRLNKLKFSLPKSIGKALGLGGRHKEYSHKNAMVMGALTFFLPCGFTQAMQLYAVSTGSISSGAIVMGLFALGTAPGLLSIGGLSSIVRGAAKERFFKVAGLAVIIFAVFNLNNGYTLASMNLTGFGIYKPGQSSIVKDPNVTMVNGVQEVRMTEDNGGYSPNKFSIKKGVPVKWIIDARAPYSCASTIVVSKLGIQKNLSAGENVIEFTPTEVGKIAFSCSMGMYTGVFNVYDGTDSTASVNSATDNAPVTRAGGCGMNRTAGGSGGGCGGGGAKTGGCGCGGASGGCGGGARTQPTNANAKPAVTETIRDSANQGSVQVIKTTYTSADYISPSSFKVKAGTKVQFQIDVRDDGTGCGSQIMIPGLYDSAETLTAGTKIEMNFVPTTPGTYDITCGMQMIRFGSITVE